MADSTTINDISKLKVVELRKELKNRGLAHTGDKAELVARLRTAMLQDYQTDINLDSDEIDSDGVLEDEDDKNHADIVLDESAVELALADQPSPQKEEAKPHKTLKRKITSSDTKPAENKETTAKKIILNRTPSVTSKIDDSKEADLDNKSTDEKDKPTESNKVKITAAIDPKTRLEMRAKRFGLPVNMTEEQRKEARKQRFNQNTNTNLATSISTNDGTLSENLDKLKKRAERFGQSVSKLMSDIEQKERLEKRAAKFGVK